jgi:hypothetical protein
MITQVLYCPYCQGTDIVRHGTCAVKISECIALSEVMNLHDRYHALHFHPIYPILELISRRPGGLPYVVVKN